MIGEEEDDGATFLEARESTIGALRRKLDLRIFPVAATLYLFAYLDRVNISNVKPILTTEEGLTEFEYSWVVSIFFVSYILCDIPANMAMTRLKPSLWLGLLGCTFGLLSMCTMFATNFGALAAVRLLLGAAESGLFPGLIYYLSFWYPPNERAFRISLITLGGNLAGAVGGLLAFGVLHIDQFLGIEGWQWLFIIEGLATIAFSLLFFVLVPNRPQDTSFLSPLERQLLLERLDQKDPFQQQQEAEGQELLPRNRKPQQQQQDEEEERPDQGHDFHTFNQGNHEALETQAIISTLTDDSNSKQTFWVTVRAIFSGTSLFFALSFFLVLTGAYSVGFYLPSIVFSLGFSPLISNLATMPIYVLAAVVVCAASYLSDKYHERGRFIMGCAIIACIGFGLIVVGSGLSSKPLALVGASVANAFLSCCTPLVLSWMSDQVDPQHMAVVSAFVVAVGNLGGIVGPQIYGATAIQQPDGSVSYFWGYVFALIDTFIICCLALIWRFKTNGSI